MSIFKSILKLIAIVLVIIAIIYIVMYLYAVFMDKAVVDGLGWLMLGKTTLTTASLLWLAAGSIFLAVLIDKDTVVKYVGKAADAVGEVIGVIGDATGDIIGSGLKGLFSNPVVVIAAIGIGLILLS